MFDLERGGSFAGRPASHTRADCRRPHSQSARCQHVTAGAEPGRYNVGHGGPARRYAGFSPRRVKSLTTTASPLAIHLPVGSC